jgi:putative transposase
VPGNLRRHDEPGHIHFWTISCFRRLGFFHIDPMKQVVADGLRLLQKKFHICLVGYVVMPDHVHVLLLPHRQSAIQPLPVFKLLNAFKQHVGYHGKECLRDYWRAHCALWSDPLNQWARREFGEQPIWTPRGHDFNIEREETLVEKLNYCHKNPVTRELVTYPDQWRWSSYRYYELHDRSVLPMDWDGRWPIVW